MNGFSLHPQLAADCHELGLRRGCRILLHHNANLPWYILVPETAALELHELTGSERAHLDAVMDELARFVKAYHASERVNVAAIGNRVPQLHVHVVGRHEGDPCWPEPVWGNLPPGPAWSQSEIGAIRQQLEL